MIEIAWVLNLDAELEFAGTARASTKHAANVEAQGRRFLASANEHCGPAVRHVAVDAARSPAATIAWCATEESAAATTWHAPHPSAVAAANHRRFAADLCERLPNARFVESRGALDRHVTPGTRWLLKRPFGFSGRNRKIVTLPLDAAAATWVDASFEQYGRGLQVEPFVALEAEFVLHAWLDPDGTRLTGEPATLRSHDGGAWLATEAGADLAPDERAALDAALETAANALHRIGYHGPFAIDAFRWRDADGEHFRPLSELNARFTMGYFVGMAGSLEELVARWTADRG